MPQAVFHRVHVLGPRLADPALQRSHQGGRFAADESAGPAHDLDFEAVPAAQDVFAQQSPLTHLLNRFSRVRDGQRVLLADVDVALSGPHGVAADQHALENRVWIALQKATVHVRAGVALIGIADDVLRVAGSGPRELPLAAGRETGAASAAEPRLRDLPDDLLRRPPRQHPGGPRIRSVRDPVLEALRIDDPTVAQHEPHLMLVEGDVLLEWDDLAGVRPAEAFDHTAAENRLLDYLRGQLGGDALVEDPLWVDHHRDGRRAQPMAPRSHHAGTGAEIAARNLSLQRLAHFQGAEGATSGRAHPDRDFLARPGRQLSSQVVECLGRFDASHSDWAR